MLQLFQQPTAGGGREPAGPQQQARQEEQKAEQEAELRDCCPQVSVCDSPKFHRLYPWSSASRSPNRRTSEPEPISVGALRSALQPEQERAGGVEAAGQRRRVTFLRQHGLKLLDLLRPLFSPPASSSAAAFIRFFVLFFLVDLTGGGDTPPEPTHESG